MEHLFCILLDWKSDVGRDLGLNQKDPRQLEWSVTFVDLTWERFLVSQAPETGIEKKIFEDGFFQVFRIVWNVEFLHSSSPRFFLISFLSVERLEKINIYEIGDEKWAFELYNLSSSFSPLSFSIIRANFLKFRG